MISNNQIAWRMAPGLLLGMAMSLLPSLGCEAADDYCTTDFRLPLQPPPGVQLYFNPINLLTPSKVQGIVLQQKYGLVATPVRGVDLFVQGQHLGFDIKRTNQYNLNFAGRSLGLRLAVLPEWRNRWGLDVGVVQEANYPNHLFRNGADLLVTSPSDDTLYGFALASCPVTDRVRLHAGLKSGTAHIGPQSAHSTNWSLGADLQLGKDWSTGLLLKQTLLQGLPANTALSARLGYQPIHPLQLGLDVTYSTRGLSGTLPALEPYAVGSFAQSFEGRGLVSVGLNLSYRFDFAPLTSKESAGQRSSAKPSPAQDPSGHEAPKQVSPKG